MLRTRAFMAGAVAATALLATVAWAQASFPMMTGGVGVAPGSSVWVVCATAPGTVVPNSTLRASYSGLDDRSGAHATRVMLRCGD